MELGTRKGVRSVSSEREARVGDQCEAVEPSTSLRKKSGGP